MFSRKERVEYVYSILPIVGAASLPLRIVLLWGQISRWEVRKVRGQGRMDSKQCRDKEAYGWLSPAVGI